MMRKLRLYESIRDFGSGDSEVASHSLDPIDVVRSHVETNIALGFLIAAEIYDFINNELPPNKQEFLATLLRLNNFSELSDLASDMLSKGADEPTLLEIIDQRAFSQEYNQKERLEEQNLLAFKNIQALLSDVDLNITLNQLLAFFADFNKPQLEVLAILLGFSSAQIMLTAIYSFIEE